MQVHQLEFRWSLVLLVAVTTITLLPADRLVQCQLFQAQSHLGRLMQSITSPLVLSAAYDASDSPSSQESDDASPLAGFGGPLSDSPAPSSSYSNIPYPAPADKAAPAQPPQHFQRYQQQQQYQPSRVNTQQQQLFHHQQALQQAPSQERRVPHQYYAGANGNSRPLNGGDSQANDDEDAGAPSSPARKQHSATQEYQMGAYLGPTIDDKEIQGAFNSNNDDKDDDEGGASASYTGTSGDGRQRAASAYASADSGPYGGSGESSYGQPDGDGPYGPGMPASYGEGRGEAAAAVGAGNYNGPRDSSSSFDEDSGADEDDEPAPGRGSSRPDASRFRTSSGPALNQAASYYHQRRQQSRPSGGAGGNQQQMLAAANGYAPYGYANGPGPIDLSSLMAGAAGGYEVYNGDGSYPGPGYYQQQGNGGGGGRGRHNQAASSMMNNGGPVGYNNAQQQQQQGRDNDEQDDADDD